MRTTRIPGLEMARAMTPPVIWSQLYRRMIVRDVADADHYRPHFQPWRAPAFTDYYQDRVAPYTLVTPERAWTIQQMARHAAAVPGRFMEAGVFRGGTAAMLHDLAQELGKELDLFDSFEGMKSTDAARDRHRAGDFADTSLEAVQRVVGEGPAVTFHKGWIPDSFAGLDARRFSFAHIDLDLYQGILDTLAFVYPRLSPGGVIVFDDYGFASCPGARRAVDEFFAGKPERPLALLTAQAVVHKL